MEIQINKKGQLSILRSGNMQDQYCMFSTRVANLEQARCGHHCPHFGEPTTETELLHLNHPRQTEPIEIKKTYLELCHGKTLYGNITDERIKK